MNLCERVCASHFTSIESQQSSLHTAGNIGWQESWQRARHSNWSQHCTSPFYNPPPTAVHIPHDSKWMAVPMEADTTTLSALPDIWCYTADKPYGNVTLSVHVCKITITFPCTSLSSKLLKRAIQENEDVFACLKDSDHSLIGSTYKDLPISGTWRMECLTPPYKIYQPWSMYTRTVCSDTD